MGAWDQYAQMMKGAANSYLGNEEKAMDPILADILAGRGGPDYQSIVDENGNLMPRYKLTGPASNIDALMAKLDAIQLNKQALEELRGRGLATGPSAFTNLMLEKEGVERGARMDETARGLNAALSRAYSDLGARGGLSRGARERLATKSMREGSRARAAVNRQGQLDRLNILGQDEETKLGILKSLPGMESQALEPEIRKTGLWADMIDRETERNFGVDKFNLQNILSDKKAKDELELAKYQERMKAWAADKTATATENSGKK